MPATGRPPDALVLREDTAIGDGLVRRGPVVGRRQRAAGGLISNGSSSPETRRRKCWPDRAGDAMTRSGSFSGRAGTVVAIMLAMSPSFVATRKVCGGSAKSFIAARNSSKFRAFVAPSSAVISSVGRCPTQLIAKSCVSPNSSVMPVTIGPYSVFRVFQVSSNRTAHRYRARPFRSDRPGVRSHRPVPRLSLAGSCRPRQGAGFCRNRRSVCPAPSFPRRDRRASAVPRSARHWAS